MGPLDTSVSETRILEYPNQYISVRMFLIMKKTWLVTNGYKGTERRFSTDLLVGQFGDL